MGPTGISDVSCHERKTSIVGERTKTHPWIINGIHNPIQPNLVDMKLQKLSSEVSSCGLIDVSVKVGGDIFFHRGQILGNLAEKLCHVRINTKKKKYTIRTSTH